MTTPALTLINDCTVGASFTVLPIPGSGLMFDLNPGEQVVTPLPGAVRAVVTDNDTGQSIDVLLVPDVTVTLRQGLTPGSCVLGTGPIPIQVTNNCGSGATAFVSEVTLAGAISITSQTLATGQSTVFYVGSGAQVFITVGGVQLGPLQPATNPAARFITLTSVSGVCTPTFTPGTGTITVTNRCRRVAVVTIGEVAGGTVLPGLGGSFVIPAGGTISYTFQSIATTLAQVCLAGRCVSVAAGGLVTLTDATGFCAPQVGAPVACPVVRC